MMAKLSDRQSKIRRRTVLASLGLLTSVGIPRGASGERTESGGEYALVQGDRCIPVTPLSGSETVEMFYDYRLPDQYVSDENGARTGNTYYSSLGTQNLQRSGTSLLFLYDGPNGLSLVVVHGRASDASSGGSATFRIGGLPSTGRWVVKDDLYRDPDTREIATSNYDRWSVDGDIHTIDWTWGGRTDGGAFRDLGVEATVTIEPAFNEAATLFGEYYEGTITEWHLLTADGDEDAPRRVSLDMTTPVEIRPGDCSTSDSTPTKTRTETPTETPTETETERKEEEKKKQRKHEKKQRKHEKKQRKHEKKQRKHEK